LPLRQKLKQPPHLPLQTFLRLQQMSIMLGQAADVLFT
jgi:hypothetical protein